jgi:SAM-dependent methyltransferase
MLNEDFLSILCCPKRYCRGALSPKNRDSLSCVDCHELYPLLEGIPLLVPNMRHSDELHKRHWDDEKRAKRYAQKYNGYLNNEGSPWGLYTHRSELAAIERLIQDQGIDIEGKTLLDCGCGNGRLLTCCSQAKRRIGIDASLTLLQETRKRDPSLWLVCGQIEDMPFQDAIADLSISIRVFQHLHAPEHAFSEMVRVTHPSGHVALELYNQYNLKELYKRFRMNPWIDRLKPWGLSHDAYHSFHDIERWSRESFVIPLQYRGAGWGWHFYLLDLIRFKNCAPALLQSVLFRSSLYIEGQIGSRPLFSKTMEKICFIGKMQPSNETRGLMEKTSSRFLESRSKKRLPDLQKLLENRNHSFAGDDHHHLHRSLHWLKQAQDATPDGGVSRGFSLFWNKKFLKKGWQPSYPEVTGYIIPTMLEAAKVLHDTDARRRARRMADWELQIMLPEGAVRGGHIGNAPKPVMFDTGQVIRGLHAMHRETDDRKYLDAAVRSAEWILKQEYQQEGRWTDLQDASVDRTATTYNVYAAAPVVELGKDIHQTSFLELGLRTMQFTLRQQQENGWFLGSDFSNGEDALLHTIAYTIDGLWDIGTLLEEVSAITAARAALDGVLSRMDEKGRIPGRLDTQWRGTVDWACLTGIAQIAMTSMKVYRNSGEDRYLEKAQRAKEFLKSCQNNFLPEAGGLGALWGSWPISGGYGTFQALSWGVKYFADLLLVLCERPR